MSDFRHLTSISRLFTVLGGLGKELWDLGSFPAHPILLFALLLALLGRRREAVPVWPVLPALGLLGGDLIVLWTTRNELQWMLATSLDRLMAQALPVILFCAMLWIAAPAAEAPAVPARRRPKA